MYNGFIGSMNNPYNAWNKPVNSLVKVTGIDGAKAYHIPPNSSVALFDGDTDTFFVKTTDENGFPTLRAFSFQEIPLDTLENSNANYVTKDEFAKFTNEIKELMNNGKHAVSDTNA
jgi:hypothetical protein